MIARLRALILSVRIGIVRRRVTRRLEQLLVIPDDAVPLYQIALRNDVHWLAIHDPQAMPFIADLRGWSADVRRGLAAND